MRLRALLIGLSLLCLLAAAHAVRADTIQFDYKSGITDTMLSKYAADHDYGDYAYAGVYNNWTGSGYQSLLRFDEMFGDGKNQIPLGSTISEATLRLYLYTGSGSDRERQLYDMTANWSDSSTWNSLGGGVSIGSQTSGTPTATYNDPGSRGFFDIDVTSSLQAWAEGSQNLGWVIIGTGTTWNYSFYASSDYRSSNARPTLSVTYSAPVGGAPEPGTLLLMGSAMALLGWRGRKRLRLLRRG